MELKDLVDMETTIQGLYNEIRDLKACLSLLAFRELTCPVCNRNTLAFSRCSNGHSLDKPALWFCVVCGNMLEYKSSWHIVSTPTNNQWDIDRIQNNDGLETVK